MFAITKVITRQGARDFGNTYFVDITDGEMVASFRPTTNTEPIGFDNLMSIETSSGSRYCKSGAAIIDIEDGADTLNADIASFLKSCYGKVPRYIQGKNAHTYFC